MNSIRIEIKWALLFVLMTLLWMVLERAVGLHDEHIQHHPIYTNVYAIPSIFIYVLALREKKFKFYNGTMAYKQGLLSGLAMTGIITILSPFTQYITSTIITPDYFSNVIKYVVNEGSMTRQEAEDYFNLKNYIIQSTGAAAVMGAITTAIVTIFIRSKS